MKRLAYFSIFIFLLCSALVVVNAQERRTLPLGTEPIRDDAACDNPDLWEGLMLDSPYYHEYTVYQGTVVVDGDTSDAAWQAIPWTICDVWDSGVADAPTVITFWEDFDDIWTSWEDKRTAFKWLWNEDEGALYLLVKDIDDANVLGPGAMDDYGGVGTGGTLWQGDCVELGFAPYEDGLPPAGRVWSYEGYFLDVEEEVRYWPVASTIADETLDLLEGDSDSYYSETAGKAIHLTIDGTTRIYELAIRLLDGMWPDAVWAWGMQVDEADEETGGNNRQGTIKFGMGKRDAGTWSSMLFSSQMVETHVSEKIEAVKEFKLQPNYPNPFNPSTTISYALREKANVLLQVFDIQGKLVAELVHDSQKPGTYTAVWDAVDFPSGLYICQLTANNYRESQTMSLIK